MLNGSTQGEQAMDAMIDQEKALAAGPKARVSAAPAAPSPSSRLVLAVLAALVGQFGVHRLYAGKVTTGVIMAALAIVGYAAYFLFVVGIVFVATVAIWSLWDFVGIVRGAFRDNAGRPVSIWRTQPTFPPGALGQNHA